MGLPHWHRLAHQQARGAALTKRDKQPSDPSLQAEAVLGAGRGALIVAMLGAGLLGWGLGALRAFNAAVGTAFGLLSLFLWAWSINTMRTGRLLGKQFPPLPASRRRAIRRSFLLVTLIEILALAFVFILSNKIRRPDLGIDWAVLVVGLHYLPLAKTFRAPVLGVLGALITFWSLLCLVMFSSNVLQISVVLGTGTLLWSASAYILLRARKIGESLRYRAMSRDS
jgi:hypothetical protein